MSQGKPHWSGLGEAGTVLGMQILLQIHRFTGRWGFRIILWPVMTYYYLKHRDERINSAEYRHRFAQSNTDIQLGPAAGFRHFLSFGEAILDKFLAWMNRIRRDDVIFADPQQVRSLDESARGGILMVSHLGNIEISRALAYQLPGIRLTILVYTQHAEKFNSLLRRLAPESHIELLQVTDMSPAVAMMLSERVDAGEYIVIAGDRTPVTGPQRTSPVQFLGHTARLPQGPYILASLLRCPISTMFCLKQAGRYHIYLEPFADAIRLPRKGRDAALTDLAQQYADRLAFYCRRAPLQWFNFFSFWAGARERTRPATQGT
ncbi:LpxL/LpxP family acyltransferase [Marinobacter mangrovi]|uniref:LpxL/LpxP family acyltransferase n=1 Tax=Marinobacter mangrovi TaxID=2803918 RepID=UPI0019324A31|nr:lipid A biosynthesis acyltransferase [Marinobacter mangrovi]